MIDPLADGRDDRAYGVVWSGWIIGVDGSPRAGHELRGVPSAAASGNDAGSSSNQASVARSYEIPKASVAA